MPDIVLTIDGSTFARLAAPYIRESLAKATADDIDPGAAECSILKMSDEARVTWGVAYPALRPDVSKAVDGHRDFADVDVIEKAAWEFLATGRKIGLYHEGEVVGYGTPVESYLHRGEPLVVKAANGTDQTVHPGDWCLSVRWEPAAWALVKSGAVNGYSPQGKGRRIPASAERLAALRT